jgi:hypothetical protein
MSELREQAYARPRNTQSRTLKGLRACRDFGRNCWKPKARRRDAARSPPIRNRVQLSQHRDGPTKAVRTDRPGVADGGIAAPAQNLGTAWTIRCAPTICWSGRERASIWRAPRHNCAISRYKPRHPGSIVPGTRPMTPAPPPTANLHPRCRGPSRGPRRARGDLRQG